MTQVVATFYKFVQLPDLAARQGTLLAHCHQQGVRGTVLLAAEGINGTIVGSREAVDSVLSFLRSAPQFADLEHRESYTDSLTFDRMKVRVKPEIVTFGVPDTNPNHQTGTHIKPEDWNDVITDPEVTVIDTRNDYEVEIGTFQRARDPHIPSFRQFPDYVRDRLDPNVHKKIAMFCTGGIRCEKASSFLLEQGFETVYQLQGGILKYLETVPTDESLWQGECFVFDQRVAVGHGLTPGTYMMCYTCGQPIPQASQQEDEKRCIYCDGLSTK
ncbi:MAG: rhodanese-related sulfurtransferase [Cyanothece sp. SIO1E1]|nr:rhodanese-related sulfurtransferase [Cyanothece sp. SIO1E1]